MLQCGRKRDIILKAVVSCNWQLAVGSIWKIFHLERIGANEWIGGGGIFLFPDDECIKTVVVRGVGEGGEGKGTACLSWFIVLIRHQVFFPWELTNPAELLSDMAVGHPLPMPRPSPREINYLLCLFSTATKPCQNWWRVQSLLQSGCKNCIANIQPIAVSQLLSFDWDHSIQCC